MRVYVYVSVYVYMCLLVHTHIKKNKKDLGYSLINNRSKIFTMFGCVSFYFIERNSIMSIIHHLTTKLRSRHDTTDTDIIETNSNYQSNTKTLRVEETTLFQNVVIPNQFSHLRPRPCRSNIRHTAILHVQQSIKIKYFTLIITQGSISKVSSLLSLSCQKNGVVHVLVTVLSHL